VCGAVIFVDGAGAEIRRLDGLADYVGFADPRSLGVREDNGDSMAGCLEVLDEGVDVWGRLVGGRTVIIYNLIV